MWVSQVISDKVHSEAGHLVGLFFYAEINYFLEM